MNSLSDLRNSFAQLELSLGKVEIARIQSEQRMEQLVNEKLRLETQLNDIQNNEKILVQSLNEKYGAGNLNPDTGVFTPNEIK
jgi:hypothetical protein